MFGFKVLLQSSRVGSDREIRLSSKCLCATCVPDLRDADLRPIRRLSTNQSVGSILAEMLVCESCASLSIEKGELLDPAADPILSLFSSQVRIGGT